LAFTASQRSHTRSPLYTRAAGDPTPLSSTIRDTCPPSIDDPSDRPNRQTVQTFSTILEHTTRFQIPADELPPLVHTGPLLNNVQRIAEMKRLLAPPPAYHDTTGRRRLSSTMHVRQFDSSEHVMNEHVLGIYTRAAWRTCVSSRVSDLQVGTAIPRFACCVFVRLVT